MPDHTVTVLVPQPRRCFDRIERNLPMSKVTMTVVAALTASLALTGFGLYRQIAANGRLESRVSELKDELSEAEREIALRDDLAKVLDTITLGLTTNREANADALSKTEKAIRNIKPTEKDSHESIDCLRTPVPANLDRLLRDTATG